MSGANHSDDGEGNLIVTGAFAPAVACDLSGFPIHCGCRGQLLKDLFGSLCGAGAYFRFVGNGHPEPGFELSAPLLPASDQGGLPQRGLQVRVRVVPEAGGAWARGSVHGQVL